MFFMTLCHFCILSFRGGALYNYYHHYADKAALYDWVQQLGLVVPAGAKASGMMETLGYIVHGDRADLANSNVADVANSIINMLGTGITIIVILLSPPLAKKFGKKAVAITGFGLAGVGSLAFYFLSPTNVWGMVGLTAFIAVCLCADDSADLGDLRGRGGLFRMEDRPPLHRHGFCDDRFRSESGPGTWLGLVPLDHGRIV